MVTHYFDTEKNEFITKTEAVQKIVKLEKRHFKKGEFFMTNFDFIRFIIKNKYTNVDLKVLLALQLRLDYNNRIKNFRQSEIAKEIGSSQPNVSKSLKKLLADRIIVERKFDYYFSDEFIKFAGDK